MWILLGGLGGLAVFLLARYARLPGFRRKAVLVEEEEAPRSADAWLDEANALIAQGRFREAVRGLYVAGLMRFDEAGVARFDRHQTNWEHLRRIEASPKRPPGTDVRAATGRFDRVWYGHLDATAEDARRDARVVRRPRPKPGRGGARVRWVAATLLGLLALAYALIVFAAPSVEVHPAPDDRGLGGLDLLTQALRAKGYRVAFDPSSRPRLAREDVAVVPLLGDRAVPKEILAHVRVGGRAFVISVPAALQAVGASETARDVLRRAATIDATDYVPPSPSAPDGLVAPVVAWRVSDEDPVASLSQIGEGRLARARAGGARDQSLPRATRRRARRALDPRRGRETGRPAGVRRRRLRRGGGAGPDRGDRALGGRGALAIPRRARCLRPPSRRSFRSPGDRGASGWRLPRPRRRARGPLPPGATHRRGASRRRPRAARGRGDPGVCRPREGPRGGSPTRPHGGRDPSPPPGVEARILRFSPQDPRSRPRFP